MCTNIWKSTGLPEAFGVTLLVFAFILSVSPYMSGKNFGIFQIPNFSEKTRNLLRIIGPIALIALILVHAPLICPDGIRPTHEIYNPQTGYQNLRSRYLTKEELRKLGLMKTNDPSYPDPTLMCPLDNGTPVEVVNMDSNEIFAKIRVRINPRICNYPCPKNLDAEFINATAYVAKNWNGKTILKPIQ